MSLDTAEVQEAVKRSLFTEKHAMDIYRLCAAKMKDERARKSFEVLAEEERAHAGSFYKIYAGEDIPSLEAYLNTPPTHEGEWLLALNKLVSEDFTEQKALELAMQKEQQLEKALKVQARKVADPEVRAVYEMNVRETHNHYLVIEAEYCRIMGMVDESDMDTYVRE